MQGVRALSADWIFVGDGESIRHGTLVIDAQGNILDLGKSDEVFPRSTGAKQEMYQGLLMPGMINAHTHIELSAMRGKVAGGQGFFPWVQQLLQARRQVFEDDELAAIEQACQEIVASGTIAVADITNSLRAVHPMARAGLCGWVFHEIFGYHEEPTLAKLNNFSNDREQTVGTWPTPKLHYAPAVHTLYTTHPTVIRSVLDRVHEKHLRTSLHLAEHEAEQEFLQHGTGPVVSFARQLGVELDTQLVPKQRAVAYAKSLGFLNPSSMVVHVTSAIAEELEFIAQSGTKVVLCPRSNLYIQLRLPPLPAILQAGIMPALGTDSLASNTTLDVMAEAKALLERFPTVDAAVLLNMVTSAGADALGCTKLGRFRVGNQPGVLHVEGKVPPGTSPLRHFITRSPTQRHWVPGTQPRKHTPTE
jgi:aminodeoxyfutalosine deaminase